METSDSDYFESADEDFHSGDETVTSDINKTKLRNCLDNKFATNPRLNTLHLQEIVQSTSCIPEINKNMLREENYTDLTNKNLTINSLEDVYSKMNIKNETTPISSIDNAESAVVKDDINLNILCKEKSLVNCSAKIKNTKKAKEKEDEMSKNDGNHLNELVFYEDAVDNEINKFNNEFDDVWNDGEGWGVDFEKDKEKIPKHAWKTEENISRKESDDWVTNKKKKDTTKIKDNTQNILDAADETIWDNDEWEPINEEEINDKAKSIKQNSDSSTVNIISTSPTWARWGNWGVSSVLSTASQGVSTLTTSVSQGLSTVLESSIGIPDPEELARLINSDSKQQPEQNKGNLDEEYQIKNSLRFGFGNIGNLVSGVSKLVESTSTKVISGGLDTLETIGKKTMEVLQEGDPGLKKKRAFLKLNGKKPVLSQVLREAKEKVEKENEILIEKHIAKKMNYETLFDDHQGLVHLEALEMLSKQCEIELQTLIESCTGEYLTGIQETIDQVKELCELPDEEENEQMSPEDIKEKLKSVVDEISIYITYDKLISVWEETELWLNNLELCTCDERELHQRAIDTLARLTAIVVERFHKTGELLLVKDHHSTADEADGLVLLTTILTSVIGIVAGEFAEKLNAKASKSSNEEEVNSFITNVFFEGAKSSSYIQDAFQLLVPVLQRGSI